MVASYARLIDEHRAWLARFGASCLKRWNDNLRSRPQGPIWEACTRRALQACEEEVVPGDDPPDFICTLRGGEPIYVEARCLEIETVTRATGVEDFFERSGWIPHPMPKLLSAVKKKVEVAAARTDAPTLVSLGTLHCTASMMSLIARRAPLLVTGTPEARIAFDASGNPQQVGTTATFDTSVFFELDRATSELRPTRRSISAVMLGDWRVVGPDAPTAVISAGVTCLLHPSALRPIPEGRFRGARMFRTRIDGDTIHVEEVVSPP